MRKGGEKKMVGSVSFAGLVSPCSTLGARSMSASSMARSNPTQQLTLEEMASPARPRTFFGRPSVTDVTGELRERAIKKKPTLRSRKKSADDGALRQYAECAEDLESAKRSNSISEVVYTEKLKEADARYRLKRLEAQMSRKTEVEERVSALKVSMKKFLRIHGGQSQAGLKRVFRAMDGDNSGELDFDEFSAAVRNYGLRNLSIGALRTLFDAFDQNGDGKVSIAEFVDSLNKEKMPTYVDEATRLVGPLSKAPVYEPKRVGFEASPARLALGSLYVGVVYEAKLDLLNTGDSALRFRVQVVNDHLSQSGAVRRKSPVRVVQKPLGLVAPGLKDSSYLEILVRSPGPLDLDVLVDTGQQSLVVPLTATLIRRESASVPSSRTAHDLFQVAYPSTALPTSPLASFSSQQKEQGASSMKKDSGFFVGNRRAAAVDEAQTRLATSPAKNAGALLEGSTSEQATWANTVAGAKLPKYVRAITTSQLRRSPAHKNARDPDGSANSVWPSLQEQWMDVQRQTAQAEALLSGINVLKDCPIADLQSLAVRLRRFSCRPYVTLANANKVHNDPAKHCLLFLAVGVVKAKADDEKGRTEDDALSSPQLSSPLSSGAPNAAYDDATSNPTLNCPTSPGGGDCDSASIGSSKRRRSSASEDLGKRPSCYRAPCYLGEEMVLTDDSQDKKPPQTLTAESGLEGFSLAYEEARELMANENAALALLKRAMFQRRFERQCAEKGGLLRANYADDKFVDAVVVFAKSKTRHGVKTDFLCRFWRLQDRVADVERAVKKDPSRRVLDFDSCLVAVDQVWADFLGEETKSGELRRPSKKSALLGSNVVTESRQAAMVAARQRALVESDFDGLVGCFRGIADDVHRNLDRAFVPDFLLSTYYRSWLNRKVPLEPCSLTKGGRRPSIGFDLPALRRGAGRHLPGARKKPAPFARPATARDAASNNPDLARLSRRPPSSPVY